MVYLYIFVVFAKEKGALDEVATKNKVEVRIGGSDYTLAGVEMEDYLRKVALYIDKKMSEITRMNNRLSTSTAAVLTAVNVADDFFKSRENEIDIKNRLIQANKEIEKLREDMKRLTLESKILSERNSGLQMELMKKDSELSEYRSYQDINAKQKIYIAK